MGKPVQMVQLGLSERMLQESLHICKLASLGLGEADMHNFSNGVREHGGLMACGKLRGNW